MPSITKRTMLNDVLVGIMIQNIGVKIELLPNGIENATRKN